MLDQVLDLAPLVRTGDFSRLRGESTRWRPRESAVAIADLSTQDQVVAFRVLPRDVAASVFEYMPAVAQRALVKAMGHDDAGALLSHVSPDDRTLFLSELPANVTKQLLALLTDEERGEAAKLLGYAAGTVGRLMTPQYIAVQGGLDRSAGS